MSQPAAGTFNLQQGVRDSVYQPGIQDWNMSLFKKFAINERAGFQFRAEAYDFINHANLNGPNLNPTSSQFGMITSKSGLGRQLQLSVRFYFSKKLTRAFRERRVAQPAPPFFLGWGTRSSAELCRSVRISGM